MKFLMLVLSLVGWILLQNGENVLATNDSVKQDATNGVALSIDILSHSNCRRLKRKGFCKDSFIMNKMCYATCKCGDLLSKESCEVFKERKECTNGPGIQYCMSTCGFCCQRKALGMQSRAIPDSKITASSMVSSNFAPPQGRLHYKPPSGKSGSWCSARNQAGQWIKVDLGKGTKVTGIATQGRYDYNQWVKSYSLQYSLDGKLFENYEKGKVFTGNKDRNTVVKHVLHPSITARYVRLVVKTWHNHICMRMELYGCKS